MIKEINEVHDVLDFVWALSQDNTKNSYHKLNSKEERKQALEFAIKCDTYKLIGCYSDAILKGVCLYFWLEEDKYAQTTVFMIDADFTIVADEILDYIKKELHGYELFIGIPFDNVNAINYFKERNIACIESSFDTRFKCKNYIGQGIDMSQNLELIDSQTFHEYAEFHDKFAKKEEMYWTSDRLRDSMDKFKIYVYRHEGKIVAGIFVHKYKDGAEIMGSFLYDDFNNNETYTELIHYMFKNLYGKYSDIEEIVYFVNEDNATELDAVLAAGFKINDTYKCYKCKL